MFPTKKQFRTATYHFLCRIEISSHHTLSVSCQSSGLKAFFWVHTPYSRRQILSSSEQEAGITGPFDTCDAVKVDSKISVENERGEFNLAISLSPRCRGCLPNLQAPAHTNGEMSARRGKLERGNSSLEGEVMNGDAPLEICQNCAAMFVDGQQKISFRRKIKTVDVCAVRKRQSVGSISIKAIVSGLSSQTAKKNAPRKKERKREICDTHTVPDQRLRLDCLRVRASMCHRE